MSQNSSALPAGVPSQTFRASLPVRRPRFVPLRIDARGAHVGRVEKSRSFGVESSCWSEVAAGARASCSCSMQQHAQQSTSRQQGKLYIVL